MPVETEMISAAGMKWASDNCVKHGIFDYFYLKINYHNRYEKSFSAHFDGYPGTDGERRSEGTGREK